MTNTNKNAHISLKIRLNIPIYYHKVVQVFYFSNYIRFHTDFIPKPYDLANSPKSLV